MTLQQTQEAPKNESNTFAFTDSYDSELDPYEQMQEDVELMMLRQGHGVRRAPRFSEE